MKKIISYCQQQLAANFHDKYPDYHLEDGKVHVLYVAPCFDSSAYYRMLAPALEMNRSASHAAIVCGLKHYDFSKQPKDYDIEIDERLIRWADYLVLPTICADINPLSDRVRGINSCITVTLDIDRNIDLLPETHPESRKIPPADRARLVANFAAVDAVTFASPQLKNYYRGQYLRYREAHPRSPQIGMTVIADRVSGLALEERIRPQQHSRLRIGIIATAAHCADLKEIVPALRAITEKRGADVEVVIFGLNKLCSVLAGLTYQRIPAVRFADYFRTLRELAFDIALLPLADREDRIHGAPPRRYLELAATGTAVIASDTAATRSCIRHGETGLLARPQDWQETIEFLIENPHAAHRMASTAFENVWDGGIGGEPL